MSNLVYIYIIQSVINGKERITVRLELFDVITKTGNSFYVDIVLNNGAKDRDATFNQTLASFKIAIKDNNEINKLIKLYNLKKNRDRDALLAVYDLFINLKNAVSLIEFLVRNDVGKIITCDFDNKLLSLLIEYYPFYLYVCDKKNEEINNEKDEKKKANLINMSFFRYTKLTDFLEFKNNELMQYRYMKPHPFVVDNISSALITNYFDTFEKEFTYSNEVDWKLITSNYSIKKAIVEAKEPEKVSKDRIYNTLPDIYFKVKNNIFNDHMEIKSKYDKLNKHTNTEKFLIKQLKGVYEMLN